MPSYDRSPHVVRGARLLACKFGGQQAFAAADVTVAPIQIRITPMTETVEPTDPDNLQFVEFHVDVIDSRHPDMIELLDPPYPQQGSASLAIQPGGEPSLRRLSRTR